MIANQMINQFNIIKLCNCVQSSGKALMIIIIIITSSSSWEDIYLLNVSHSSYHPPSPSFFIAFTHIPSPIDPCYLTPDEMSVLLCVFALTRSNGWLAAADTATSSTTAYGPLLVCPH